MFSQLRITEGDFLLDAAAVESGRDRCESSPPVKDSLAGKELSPETLVPSSRPSHTVKDEWPLRSLMAAPEGEFIWLASLPSRMVGKNGIDSPDAASCEHA